MRLSEHEDPREELGVLQTLMHVLFELDAIDEAAPLVVRYRELAKAELQTDELMSSPELMSFYYTARLHEVPCICTPLHTALPLRSSKADGVCHRIHLARVLTYALREPSVLSRHAESLKTPRRRCALCSPFCARTRQQSKECSQAIWLEVKRC